MNYSAEDPSSDHLNNKVINIVIKLSLIVVGYTKLSHKEIT